MNGLDPRVRPCEEEKVSVVTRTGICIEIERIVVGDVRVVMIL